MTPENSPTGPPVHLLQSALEVLQERSTLDRLGAILDNKLVDLLEPSVRNRLRPMYIAHVERLADVNDEWGLEQELLDALILHLKEAKVRLRYTSDTALIQNAESLLESISGLDGLLTSLTNLLDQGDGGDSEAKS
jgi:hypothetical protein